MTYTGEPGVWEISRVFRFDAAHTLARSVDAEPSQRIHGHSYQAEIFVRGRPDPSTGMVVDLGELDRALAHARDGLDHRFLDEIDGLGPGTIENLARWIWRTLRPNVDGLARVVVGRPSLGDACSYHEP